MLKRTIPALLVLCFAVAATQLRAQTTTTGELAGMVTDPSGAVLPNISVTLTNPSTGSKQVSQTNATGAYRFPLLQPGTYRVTASASGFRAVDKTVDIGLGASATANLQLGLGSSRETVEVSGEVSSVETEDANLNTNFSAKQVELLPNPGNDLSAVALTSPGAVMNTAGGSMFGGGNFEVFGLPATSNLFTVDGSNYNDPYFNVNNSGATNLTLGLNDVQESAVVTNGYSGSYGGLAGANINYVSKSGGNNFHGNLEYWWNGTVLNANEYFRNQAGDPRAPVNANQFAGSFGGPIKRDKAFFFFDYEGIYLAIPSPLPVNVPTPAFQGAVINYLNANGLSASLPFYNQAFAIYNRDSQATATALGPGVAPTGIPGTAAGTVWSGGGCNDVTPMNPAISDPTGAFAAFGPGGSACAVQVQAAASAHTHDAFYAGRFDQNIGNRDKMFVRVEHEHGLQATFTDPFTSAFNVISDQPQWQSNFAETHTFGTDKINSFNTSLLWYSAGFTMANPSAAATALTGLPGSTMTLAFNDGSLAALNSDNFLMPEGRNITQYQFVDDFSWVHGRHTFRVGANFRRDDISDQNFILVTPEVVPLSLSGFATGGVSGSGSAIVQNFPSKIEEPIALYQLGVYGSDDVRVSNTLKLTLSLRLEHLSNPVCQNNCFQHLAETFGSGINNPVNQAIDANQHQAFPSVSGLVAQPKIGFAWQPFGGSKPTVVRGGIGIFSDALPTGAIDDFMTQAPLDPQFLSIGALPLSPAQPGNVFLTSQAANATFQSNYSAGGLGCATAGANPLTCVPAFSFYNATPVKVPRYYEWSLEVQQGLGWNSTLSLMYVGNHGTHEEISNLGLNAYSSTPFADLPTSPVDPRFGVVSQQQNVANSNYDGLIATLKHNFGAGLTFQGAYTWSHSLDEISNNSLSPFGLNTTGFYADIINPQDPYNIRAYNYGNSDYDIRQNFSANYVWADGIRHLTGRGPNALMKGWSLSGTLFAHSGLPFTVVSSNLTGDLQGSNYGPSGGTQQVFANVIGSTTNGGCGISAATLTGAACLNASNFSDPTNTWGAQRRNQFRGPNYFDTDFGIEKAFGIPKWETGQVSIGARFFNIFNHPDFYFPVMNLDNTANFGHMIQTIGTPTSIFGSGLGANASPRLVQLQAKFTF
jgi:Carboxypeptidase regulatory-like domain